VSAGEASASTAQCGSCVAGAWGRCVTVILGGGASWVRTEPWHETQHVVNCRQPIDSSRWLFMHGCPFSGFQSVMATVCGSRGVAAAGAAEACLACSCCWWMLLQKCSATCLRTGRLSSRGQIHLPPNAEMATAETGAAAVCTLQTGIRQAVCHCLMLYRSPSSACP